MLDEFGGTAGIVTIEDILTEVLGDIRSEHSPERAVIEKLGENRWRVSGSVLLDNFRREYPPLPDLPGFETMAGMALHEFEVVPARGESVVASGLRLTVQVGRRAAHSGIVGGGCQEEMSDTNILLLLATLMCVALSFLFSGMETGVLALNRFRVRQLMRSGDRRAAVLQGFLQKPEDFIWTILVGNTVVNFVIFSLGFLQLQKDLGHRRVLEVAVFLTGVFLFYIVCELAPKTVFQRYPNRLSLFDGVSVSLDPSDSGSVGRGGRLVFARPAPLDRRAHVTPGTRHWQPRRIALRHAGIGARFDAGGKGDDQSRA